MGKSVSNVMELEMGAKPRVSVSKRVTRRWAVKETTKHLDKLSTPQIMLYVVRRHSTLLTWSGFILGWFIAGLLAFSK